MINKIFWDIDETLIHTLLQKPEQEHIEFTLAGYDTATYYTIIRPCAVDLIEFSRELVGKDNVYILTSSIEDYANEINRLAGFGFEKDHIIHRGDIQKYTMDTAYGGECTASIKSLANKDNVLIDNLPPRYNISKMSLIDIKSDRYLQIDDYFGVNFTDDTFETDVKNFLTAHASKHE